MTHGCVHTVKTWFERERAFGMPVPLDKCNPFLTESIQYR
jgi:hypothetical protein